MIEYLLVGIFVTIIYDLKYKLSDVLNEFSSDIEYINRMVLLAWIIISIKMIILWPVTLFEIFFEDNEKEV